MRNGIMLIATVTAIALTYNFGNRLSSQSIALVAGAVCGIAASIPVSLALFIAASRNWGRAEAAREEPIRRTPRARRAPAQPPVVVISPSQVNPAPFSFQTNPFYLPQNMLPVGAPREFKVVGDD